MIFYGSNARRINHGKISNVICPDCGTSTYFNYSVFGKYAHIYWIPLFPVGKKIIVECGHCKKTFEKKELPKEITQKIIPVEKDSKAPVWQYSGLFVIACIIASVIYAGKVSDRKELEYLQAPAIGDVYSYESSEDNHYSTMKVVNILDDSITVSYNTYEIDKKYSTDQIDKEENYEDFEEKFSLNDIKELYSKEIIYEINRKK